MGYLYLTDSSCQVGVKDNYVSVKYLDHESRVPLETLESISLFGRAQITSQCIQECLKRGIPISYYSKGGIYFGRIHSTGHVNVERQRIQAGIINTQLGIDLSKRIVKGKIHNQIVVLRRYARSKDKSFEREIVLMKDAGKHIDRALNIQQIMGHEGHAAKIYFRCLSELVESNFAFTGRSRRPPRDPFNSMISLGYSILMNEIYGKIENKGLHPYFGFLHQDHEKHPTLASDLMEEWRAVIVDSMVMSLINGHEIRMEHFITNNETQGVFLTKDGLKIFLGKMEKKLHQETNYLEYVPYSVSFRRAIELQVGSFADVMESGNAETYSPVWIR